MRAPCSFELTVSHADMPKGVENSSRFESVSRSVQDFTQPISELTSLLLIFLVVGYATLTTAMESILVTTRTRGNVFNTD